MNTASYRGRALRIYAGDMWMDGMRLIGTRVKDMSPRQGESFCRPTRFDCRETAKIIYIGEDQAGIPHVRFNLRIESQISVTEETRTLSLESFRRLYQAIAPRRA